MQISALRNRLFVYAVVAAGMTGAAMPSLIGSSSVGMSAPTVELDAAGEPIIEPETTAGSGLTVEPTDVESVSDENASEEEAVADTVICHIGHGHNRHAHRGGNHENSHKWRTKTVTAEAAAQHIAHGDHEGACTGEEVVAVQSADFESHGRSSDDDSDDESKDERGENHGRNDDHDDDEDDEDDDLDEDENQDEGIDDDLDDDDSDSTTV